MSQHSYIYMPDEDGTAVFALALFSFPVGLQMFLQLRRKPQARAPELPLPRPPYGGKRRHSPPYGGRGFASVALLRLRRHSPTRSEESSDDPPAAAPRVGRVGDQKATLTHPTPTHTGTSFVRTFLMSDEDGTAVFALGLQMFLQLRRKPRARALELPLPRPPYGSARQHSPTHPDLATPHVRAPQPRLRSAGTRRPFPTHTDLATRCAGAAPPRSPCGDKGSTLRRIPTWRRNTPELPCLDRTLWHEAAISDFDRSGNATCWNYLCLGRFLTPTDGIFHAARTDIAPELPLSSRPVAARGGNLQHRLIWQRHALELPLLWSPYDGQRWHFPTQFELTLPCTGAATVQPPCGGQRRQSPTQSDLAAPRAGTTSALVVL